VSDPRERDDLVMTDKQMKKHIYGPVPSRRLGRSLGVDIVPFKVCSYDCVYCQLGSRGKPIIERKPYINAHEILSQLSDAFNEGVCADVITIAGSGEPTLNSDLPVLLEGIKKITEIPLVVLTNGSMLWNPDVRESLMAADVAAPSLDAWDAGMFEKINRPHKGLDFETMVRGLADFRKVFSGKIWLEIFVMEGINDTGRDAANFLRHIDRIQPDKIHINTAARPTAESFAKRASQEALEGFRDILGETAEIIVPFKGADQKDAERDLTADILNMLGRRPCTQGDMANGLSANRLEILKYIAPLLEKKRIQPETRGKKIYYRLS